MHDGDDEECIETGRKTFPADNQPAVLALKPCECPFSLKARDALFDRSPTWLPSLPHPFRDLGANPACAEVLTKPLGIIPFIGRHDLEPFTGPAPFARADAHGIQQGDDLGPLVAIRGRGTRR
jgi:hypothetical protein